MQASEDIELWKIRSAGDAISDGLVYLRRHFRTLGRSILYIAGPPLLLLNFIAWWMSIDEVAQGPFAIFMTSGFKAAFMSYALGFINLHLMVAVVAEYVTVYDRLGDDITVMDVWEAVKGDSGRIAISIFLIIIMVGMGIFLFVVGGIYLYVLLSIMLVVAIREDLDISQAISRCYELQKAQWWSTFGVVLLTWILTLLLQWITALPTLILVWTEEFSEGFYDTVEPSPWSLGAVLLARLGAALTQIIPAVALMMHYHTLVERLDGTGILRRIERLGEAPAEAKENYQW